MRRALLALAALVLLVLPALVNSYVLSVAIAILYLAYSGRADWSEGLGRGPIYVGAEFEAGDERYRWLNALHLFGRGGVADGGVRYEFFQGV